VRRKMNRPIGYASSPKRGFSSPQHRYSTMTRQLHLDDAGARRSRPPPNSDAPVFPAARAGHRRIPVVSEPNRATRTKPALTRYVVHPVRRLLHRYMDQFHLPVPRPTGAGATLRLNGTAKVKSSAILDTA
jgi:hypothetical protein